MAVRVKGLIAFVMAVVFIFMTLNSIFPRGVDRPDNTAHVNPYEAATATEAAAADREGMPPLADERIHDNGHHTTTTHETPDQQPTSPIAEWDVIDSADQTHQDVSTTASRNRPTPDHSSNTDFRILIGVMNPFHSALRRQIMRNAYNQFPKDLPFDVWFVMGDVEPWNPDNAEKVRDTSELARDWENSTYGDIMGLDCFENMEEGKTYEYLKKVGLDFSDRYTHVMKTDDDSFVNIPGFHPLSNSF
jgi:hypothetical protein